MWLRGRCSRYDKAARLEALEDESDDRLCARLHIRMGRRVAEQIKLEDDLHGRKESICSAIISRSGGGARSRGQEKPDCKQGLTESECVYIRSPSSSRVNSSVCLDAKADDQHSVTLMSACASPTWTSSIANRYPAVGSSADQPGGRERAYSDTTCSQQVRRDD